MEDLLKFLAFQHFFWNKPARYFFIWRLLKLLLVAVSLGEAAFDLLKPFNAFI